MESGNVPAPRPSSPRAPSSRTTASRSPTVRKATGEPRTAAIGDLKDALKKL